MITSGPSNILSIRSTNRFKSWRNLLTFFPASSTKTYSLYPGMSTTNMIAAQYTNRGDRERTGLLECHISHLIQVWRDYYFRYSVWKRHRRIHWLCVIIPWHQNCVNSSWFIIVYPCERYFFIGSSHHFFSVSQIRGFICAHTFIIAFTCLYFADDSCVDSQYTFIVHDLRLYVNWWLISRGCPFLIIVNIVPSNVCLPTPSLPI